MAALAWSAWRDCLAALATIHSSADRPSPFAAGEGHLTQQARLPPGKASRSVGRSSDPAPPPPSVCARSDRAADTERVPDMQPRCRPPTQPASDGQGIARPGRR